MDRRTVSFSGMLGIPPECSVERLAAAAAKSMSSSPKATTSVMASTSCQSLAAGYSVQSSR